MGKKKQIHIYIDGLYGSNLDDISKKLFLYAKQFFTKEYKTPIIVKEPFIKKFKDEIKTYYNTIPKAEESVENWHYVYESSQKRKSEYNILKRKNQQIFIHTRGWITDLLYSDGNFPKWDYSNKNILPNSIYIMVKPNQTIVNKNLLNKRKRFERMTQEDFHKYSDRIKHLYMNLVQRKIIKDYVQITDTAPHTNVKVVLNDIRDMLN